MNKGCWSNYLCLMSFKSFEDVKHCIQTYTSMEKLEMSELLTYFQFWNILACCLNHWVSIPSWKVDEHVFTCQVWGCTGSNSSSQEELYPPVLIFKTILSFFHWIVLYCHILLTSESNIALQEPPPPFIYAHPVQYCLLPLLRHQGTNFRFMVLTAGPLITCMHHSASSEGRL